MALSHPIASELSYEVAQLRRLRGELGPERPHAVPLTPDLLPQEGIRIVNRTLRELDGATPEDRIPTWGWHGRRKR